MSEQKNRRIKLFANKTHKQVFLIISTFTIVPTILVTICLFYLIFNVMATQLGIPEAIAYNIIPAAKKVTAIILISAPLTISIMLYLSYKITHRLLGPFDRIIKELDGCIEGQKQGPIIIRKADKCYQCVKRINILLDKLKKG
jgi:hypothetical protein